MKLMRLLQEVSAGKTAVDKDASVFVCGVCEEEVFLHVMPEGDCESLEGWCGELVRAGWKPLIAKLCRDAERQAFIVRASWACPACCQRYSV